MTAAARTSARCLRSNLLLPLLAAFGCQGASNGNPYPPPTNGGSPGHMPSGMVTVTIDTPAATDPPPIYNAESLIDLRVRVDVEGGTDFVDGTTVKSVVTKRGGGEALESGKLVFDMADVYTGRVSLGQLPSGSYTLTVSAQSSGGAIGNAHLDFDIDAGPSITINAPVEGKSYKRMLTIEVVVTDPFGLSGSPTATIGTVAVPLDGNTGVADTYRGTIDFDAQMPPLFGNQLLTVDAVNAHGKRTEVQLIFVIDNDGPIITQTHPVPGEIVGGIVQIAATIVDNAGILDSSVVAVIGDEAGTPLFELPLKPFGSGIYGVLFDSSRFVKCPDPPATGVCLVYPTLSFRASDQVGNEATLGYEFALDNIAPVADLDPEDVRMIRKDGYCSRLFDPLSLNRFIGDMPNDMAVVPQVFDLRARIQDSGNAPVGIKEVPIAGIDPNATNVYVLDDTSQPLIVDIDGDGTCDAINPKLIPTTRPPTQNNQVLQVRLAGVKGQGAPDYRDDGNSPPASICTYPPVALPPEYLCDNGQPFVTITYAHGAPCIWSVEPINDAWCMGSQFDTRANKISEGTGAGDPRGWACLAVQAADLSGNTSVSPALRVYIRYNGAGAGATAPASFGAPPSCTGIYDKASDTVMPGSCTTRRFDKVDYVFDNTQ